MVVYSGDHVEPTTKIRALVVERHYVPLERYRVAERQSGAQGLYGPPSPTDRWELWSSRTAIVSESIGGVESAASQLPRRPIFIHSRLDSPIVYGRTPLIACFGLGAGKCLRPSAT